MRVFNSRPQSPPMMGKQGRYVASLARIEEALAAGDGIKAMRGCKIMEGYLAKYLFRKNYFPTNGEKGEVGKLEAIAESETDSDFGIKLAPNETRETHFKTHRVIEPPNRPATFDRWLMAFNWHFARMKFFYFNLVIDANNLMGGEESGITYENYPTGEIPDSGFIESSDEGTPT